MGEIVFKDESYAIMGACFDVHCEMGAGFLEAVYQECLAIEFTSRKIPFHAEVNLPLAYKGRRLEKTYKPDFVLYDKIILEIKAVSELTDLHRAQVHNYLKATGHQLGLLVNFNRHPKLAYERIVR